MSIGNCATFSLTPSVCDVPIT